MGGRRRANGVAAAAASCLELASLGREGPGSVSTASVCSAFSYLDGEADDIQVDEFEKRLDSLFEKRGSTREKALESLAVMLRVDYRFNDCLEHTETLTSRCLTALKRGSAVESSLASQLLGLHILTLGQPDESLFQSLRPELERTAGGSNGGGSAVQVAAADTLALAAFVLAEDEEGSRGVMDRLRAMWGKGDAKVRAAAVRGWSFLVTLLDCQMGEHEAAACLGALAGLLGERDLELRTAAGEAVGVMRACGCADHVLDEMLDEQDEQQQREEDERAGDEEEDEDCGEEKDGVGSAAAAGGRSGGGSSSRKQQQQQHANGRGGRRATGDSGGELGDLVERMQELACNQGDKLRRSRRERASQRSTFRGLMSALSGESLPECRIKLQHGDCLQVEGVAATHRLAFLRRFLAGGFQAHLQRNPLLHDVFGYRPRTERPERMSAVEKRLNRSCHSADAKARTADRRWSRDAKASRMGFGY
ncbi:hypothetical protein PLESTB_000430000 [Pleodorina starrii]|uniref:Interferon-related developmental regulator N-terminal domain-containing protein n=1 Tax=Pleodorina starrii TaxID=330485 RepID=A0A9W6BET6_9CHLO|nr:hypothetical protein PLESTM_001693900 [Pleodorina starrii]GLC50769.1 hypothetical protein PLESTB_000430000 [Pleodorina starrii]GLC74322.1 hypothetical protein PLESTF_001499300 [Pleodorina starrii]